MNAISQAISSGSIKRVKQILEQNKRLIGSHDLNGCVRARTRAAHIVQVHTVAYGRAW